MNFPQLLSEDRRLVILRLLSAAPEYTLNAFVLRHGLEAVGHAMSTDQLATELAWLAEQGLLELSAVAEVTVARLTSRGADVAAGRAVTPGVKRPEPGVNDMMALGLNLIRGKMGG
ncbi:MAG: ArsR family transcriptional regulator [Proteobacteria bacterium]|nr:ArsR family transcriptional regulator [Pseudomonadota bacterium]